MTMHAYRTCKNKWKELLREELMFKCVLQCINLTTRVCCCITDILVDSNVWVIWFFRLPDWFLKKKEEEKGKKERKNMNMTEKKEETVKVKQWNFSFPLLHSLKWTQHGTAQTWETWNRASDSSFWLIPQRLATFFWQLLWTFMPQSARRAERGKQIGGEKNEWHWWDITSASRY